MRLSEGHCAGTLSCGMRAGKTSLCEVVHLGPRAHRLASEQEETSQSDVLLLRGWFASGAMSNDERD
jgi:hypothetical protein